MRALLASLPFLLVACGDSSFVEVSGSVEGHVLDAATAYWGGPFVVVTSADLDCIDMSWVTRTYVDGDAAPIDQDLTAIQFTYNESDVATGTYSVEGDAPVHSQFLALAGGALNAFKGRTGSLIIDEITKKDHLLGSFSIGFDDGQLDGSFDMISCNNLKSKY